MKITGGCHCGEITFEADVDPEKVGICHCADCQILSASAYRTVIAVDPSEFEMVGTPKEYVKVADSGRRRVQTFCGTCGSALYSVDPDNPLIYNFRTGVIDQRADLPPKFEIWCQSALPWVPRFSDTKQTDGNPY